MPEIRLFVIGNICAEIDREMQLIAGKSKIKVVLDVNAVSTGNYKATDVLRRVKQSKTSGIAWP